MENPAKFMRQNKGRDMNDKTMKALANDILAKLRKGKSISWWTPSPMLHRR